MRSVNICAVTFAAALLVVSAVNGASQPADPSEIVPEVTPILELDAAGSGPGSAAEGPQPYTAEDVDRTPGYEGTKAPIDGGVDGDLSGNAVRDDPSDAEPGSGEGGPGTDNSAGVNKLTGGGKTSDMGSAGVKSPGYTPEDSWSDKQGHYYLGPSRRRVGAGFGRRRTAPEHVETAHEAAKDHDLIKNLTMGMAGDVPPPPPPAAEQVKKMMAVGEGKDSPDAITPAPTPSPTAGNGCGDIVPGYRRTSGPNGPNRCREGALRINGDIPGSIEKAAAACDKTHKCQAFTYVDGGANAGNAGYFSTCNMFDWIAESKQPAGTQSWEIFETCSGTPKLDFTPCGCYNNIPKAKSCDCKYMGVDLGTCSGCCRGFGYDSSSAPLCTSDEDTVLPTPAPTKYQLLVRVTTGTIDYADSDMQPQIVVTGDKGEFTGTFGTGNKKGAVETTTFHPNADIGEVQKVHINSENGNGWFFTEFEVKSGNNDWVSVGCTDQWLDAEIDSGTYNGKMYGTKADLHPITEHCIQSTPASWGAPTKTGCFCKMSGVSGTCGLNGDPTPWCRTKDNCIGTKSGFGNWDHCTMEATPATPAPTATPTSTPEPTPAPTTPAPTPSPTKYQLLLRVTTGKEPYADSNMKVKLVITGSLDKYTGYFHGGSKGQVKTSTLHPPGDIGEVKHVTISSKSGNGWYFTKFEVKSGNLDWTQVGCTDQWLDGKIDATPYGGSGLYGTHIELHPIQEHCAASVPEDWGTRTKEGCFCKNHGKSGKCSKHGSSYAWCKTMNGCKGHGSSYSWDKCTPGPKDQ